MVISIKYDTLQRNGDMTWFHYADGADFPSSSADITIRPDQSIACAPLPITDEGLAREGDETFEVVLNTPPDVPNSSPGPSTVTIIDDDGMHTYILWNYVTSVILILISWYHICKILWTKLGQLHNRKKTGASL